MIDSIKKILFLGSLNDDYLSNLVLDLSSTVDKYKLELYRYSPSNDQNDISGVKQVKEDQITDMDLIVSIGGMEQCSNRQNWQVNTMFQSQVSIKGV